MVIREWDPCYVLTFTANIAQNSCQMSQVKAYVTGLGARLLVSP